MNEKEVFVHAVLAEHKFKSMIYDYLIIGGGITGVTAAETVRKKDVVGSIGVITDEPHTLYSRVLLPSYLKKRISREQVFLRRAEDFTKKGIDFSVAEEVVSVSPSQRSVALSNGVSLGYKKLLVTTGGRAKPWGRAEDQDFIYRLQTLDDADRLQKALSGIKHPLVIGSSFISLEFLEIFFLNHMSPVLLSRDPYFFGRLLDEHGGEIMRNNFERHGITVVFDDSLSTIGRGETGEPKVVTEKGKHFEADALAVGIGLEKNTGFMRDSGLELNEKGIRVNEYLETNVESVFAAGDVADFWDVISGTYRSDGNWTNAFLQGKHAGLNMAGERSPFRNVSTYSITNLGLNITALGNISTANETVVRINTLHDQYERFFLKEDILVGAVLINKFQDKPYLSKLIGTKTSLGDFRGMLGDSSFDIRNIPVVE